MNNPAELPYSFAWSAIQSTGFKELADGEKVEYEIGQGAGPQAEQVHRR